MLSAPAHSPAVTTALATFSVHIAASASLFNSALRMMATAESANSALVLGFSTCRAFHKFVALLRSPNVACEDGLVIISDALEPESTCTRAAIYQDLDEWAKRVPVPPVDRVCAWCKHRRTPEDPGSAWVHSLVISGRVPWEELIGVVRGVLYRPRGRAGFTNSFELPEDHSRVRLSLIHHVIRQRYGLPLMICVILQAVCRRAGLGALVEVCKVD